MLAVTPVTTATSLPVSPMPKPPALLPASTPPVVTVESVQALMQTTAGSTTTEQLVALMNSLMAAAMSPPALANGVLPTIPSVDDTDPATHARAEEEKRLAEDLRALNGGGKPGKPAKTSNRVDPLK